MAEEDESLRELYTSSNLFTDIANAAMESGVADGSIPKWRATLYGQDVWKELL